MSGAAAQSEPAAPRRSLGQRWRALTGWSVRVRVLTALIALSGLALLAAGTTAFVLERNRLDADMQESMQRSAREFVALAQEGRDPERGTRFTDPGQLLNTTMGRIVPAEHEGMLGFVDGRLAYTAPSTVPLRLEEDAELVQALVPSATGQDQRFVAIETTSSVYMAVIVPIRVGDSPPGALALAYDRAAEHAELARTYTTYAVVALGALAFIGLIGFGVVSDLLKPIKLVREEASQISGSDLSRRVPVVGNDDLALLSSTINEMLNRLESAFSSQRELLDDVGHELRTPLTVVGGHLELMDPADPEDAAQVRAIALDELDRMNMLVEELMTLAKARRPDFVTPQPTDVGLLTEEVLAKARPLGSRQWQLDGLAEITADLDARRITQAWLQLAGNAVKFSDDGSVVALGSQVVAGRLRLWVRDEGIGIAPQDQHRVWERFTRVGASTTEGSGLGLTIVRSIAQAHVGDVELESEPGRGTMITMTLPVQPQLEHEPEGRHQ